MRSNEIGRILIYRLGSIGDFVVALPCLHLLRSRFPTAEIRLLTNEPVDSRAAPAASLLEGAGVIDGYLVYPAGAWHWSALVRVARAIRCFKPDLLVYLVARQSVLPVYRDFLFFQSCGVRRAVGFPFTRNLRLPRQLAADRWEPEAERLGRCIAALGAIDIRQPSSWDLGLSKAERAEADWLLSEADLGPGRLPFISVAIGTKQAMKDWGEANWRTVLGALARTDLGLALIGSAGEFERSRQVAAVWPGRVVNFCGRLPPRLSAAVIAHSRLLLCHDSGPMHLAGSVGTRCVAVFSNKNLPGQWFPFGDGHEIIRPPTEADAIGAIVPDVVIAAASRALSVDAAGDDHLARIQSGS